MTTPMDEHLEMVLRGMTAAPDKPSKLWRKALRGAPTKSNRRWFKSLAAAMVHRPIATAAVLVIGIGALFGAGAVTVDALPLGSRQDHNRAQKPNWLVRNEGRNRARSQVNALVGRDFVGYNSLFSNDAWAAICASNTTPSQFICPSTTETPDLVTLDDSAFRSDQGTYGFKADGAWDRSSPRDPQYSYDMSAFAAGDRILVPALDEVKSYADSTGSVSSAAFFDSNRSQPSSPAPAASHDDLPLPASDRHVIRRAVIQLKTDDVRGVFLKSQLLLETGHGEYVEQSAIRGEAENATAELTLRVAAGRLSAVLNELRELGKVQSENLTGEDVTMQVVDIEARLRNERRVEAEVLELLESRKDAPLDEVLKLRQTLGEIRTRIETMTGTRERLGRLVSLATILVLIRTGDTPPVEPKTLWTDFGESMSAAWHNGWVYLGSLVATIVNVLIGGLVFWVALVGVIWYVRRRLLRRAAGG